MCSIYEKALLHKYVLAYQLTPLKRVLLEKLHNQSKNFPHCWNPKFLYLIHKACHVSLSCPTLIQSTPSNLILLRFILIFSSHLHLGLSSGSFLQISLPKPCIHLSFFLACAKFSSHLTPLNSITHQCLLRSKNHKALRYTLFSSLLLLPPSQV